MIKGIEDFETKLQKAILECIASLFDLSADIEVEEIDEHIIRIDDVTYFVITDAEQAGLLANHNTQAFDDYFDNLTPDQMKYINEDLWDEDNGIHTFEEWITEHTDYTVKDNDYYGAYNFYEIC